MILNNNFFFFNILIKLSNIKFFKNIHNFNNKIMTSKQKSRGEVNFSNIKPWKQKGTGKARAGSKSSPIWRGGGKIFPNIPLKFKKKINKRLNKKIFFFLFKKGFDIKKIFFIKIPRFEYKTFLFLEFLNNLIKTNKKKILFVLKKKKMECMKNIKNINFIYYKNFFSCDIINNEIIFIDIFIIDYYNDIFKNIKKIN
ncbi:50S ribosomal protein L4 [Candidatus Vidania fulgoroideorum]